MGGLRWTSVNIDTWDDSNQKNRGSSTRCMPKIIGPITLETLLSIITYKNFGVFTYLCGFLGFGSWTHLDCISGKTCPASWLNLFSLIFSLVSFFNLKLSGLDMFGTLRFQWLCIFQWLNDFKGRKPTVESGFGFWGGDVLSP